MKCRSACLYPASPAPHPSTRITGTDISYMGFTESKLKSTKVTSTLLTKLSSPSTQPVFFIWIRYKLSMDFTFF